jgi:hypothetical protein
LLKVNSLAAQLNSRGCHNNTERDVGAVVVSCLHLRLACATHCSQLQVL